MTTHTHTFNIDRCYSLMRMMPDLFSKPRDILYIGARADSFDFGDLFRQARCEITVLEAFKENVEHLRTLPWLHQVIQADIDRFRSIDDYDLIFWWHGPEHIAEERLPYALSYLECCASEAVILGCPWGESEQGAIHDNPFEIHKSHLDYRLFESLGYDTECLGYKDQPGSHITAIKRINK